MTAINPLSYFLNKLRKDYDLCDGEVQAWFNLPFHLREYGENSDLMRQGDRPSQCCLIVDGLACRFKVVTHGSRQIISIHIPHDMPDLQGLYLAHSDYYVGTLARSTVAFVPHEPIKEVIAAFPRLASCLWRETLIDGSIFAEWIVNTGRRDAHRRIAHLLCELALRYRRVGLGDETGFPWLLTQTNMADAAGLSVVHVNRMMQKLRVKGLIGNHDKKMHIKDWPGLVEEAEFDATYLHLN